MPKNVLVKERKSTKLSKERCNDNEKYLKKHFYVKKSVNNSHLDKEALVLESKSVVSIPR